MMESRVKRGISTEWDDRKRPWNETIRGQILQKMLAAANGIAREETSTGSVKVKVKFPELYVTDLQKSLNTDDRAAMEKVTTWMNLDPF